MNELLDRIAVAMERIAEGQEAIAMTQCEAWREAAQANRAATRWYEQRIANEARQLEITNAQAHREEARYAAEMERISRPWWSQLKEATKPAGDATPPINDEVQK